MLKGKDVHRIHNLIFSAAVGSYLLPLYLSSIWLFIVDINCVNQYDEVNGDENMGVRMSK
jgi:hypothetical protein